jgi:hypothetical protein
MSNTIHWPVYSDTSVADKLFDPLSLRVRNQEGIARLVLIDDIWPEQLSQIRQTAEIFNYSTDSNMKISPLRIVPGCLYTVRNVFLPQLDPPVHYLGVADETE